MGHDLIRIRALPSAPKGGGTAITDEVIDKIADRVVAKIRKANQAKKKAAANPPAKSRRRLLPGSR